MNPPRYSGPARIWEVEEAGLNRVRLVIPAPPIARSCQPGQFLTLRLPDSLDPLLPRPFSIHQTRGDTVVVLVEAVGRVSRRLLELRPGDNLLVAGPLGRGFRPEIAERGKRHILVAGGMGVAPFPLLLQRLTDLGEKRVEVLIGARSPEKLYHLPHLPPGYRERTITEEGPGERGVVTDLLARTLAEGDRPGMVYACGPREMLQAVARTCQQAHLPCQLSLETLMACGTGLCQGCVVRLRTGDYARVCREGPVFPANQLAIPWWEPDPQPATSTDGTSAEKETPPCPG